MPGPGDAVPWIAIPSVNNSTQALTIGATQLTTAADIAAAQAVTIYATADCFVAMAATALIPSAGSPGSMPIPANQYVACTKPAGTHIAVVGASGTVYITPRPA